MGVENRLEESRVVGLVLSGVEGSEESAFSPSPVGEGGGEVSSLPMGLPRPDLVGARNDRQE